jgi:ankyrin repeat protein
MSFRLGTVLLLFWPLLPLGGQESAAPPQPRVVLPTELEGIAVGYEGHYACRHFVGSARQLAIAVSDGERDLVWDLVQAGADVDAKSVEPHGQGMTLLQTAVVYEWGAKSTQLLIEAGADVNARDQRGHSALTLACSNPCGANLEVVEQLMAAGSAIDGKGPGGMTALMYAAVYDLSSEAVQVLLKASADVTARDNRGWTALMHATRRRTDPIGVVQLLVQAGAQVNARNASGGTALSHAAYQGHVKTVQYLIGAGAEVNTRDNASWTPLICSSINGHAQIAQLLIDAGANLNEADRLGRTALRLARDNGRTAVEQVLISRGARE